MKYLISFIAIFIVIAVGCYFWYQWELAPYKREAAATQQYIREWQTSQTDTDRQTAAQTDRQTQADPLTPEHPIEPSFTEKTGVASETGVRSDVAADNGSDRLQPTDVAESVRVSPFGFGAYPKIPAIYRDLDGVSDIWAYYEELGQTDPEAARMNELGERVLVKLWNHGLNPTGGTHSKGRFYPNYPNTVYVTWEEDVLEDGTIQRYPTKISGDPSFAAYEAAFIESDGKVFPSGYTMLDHQKDGIDPYQFLNLP